MTELEFRSLQKGDIVEIIDWPGFKNENMRPFIGRLCEVVSKYPPTKQAVLSLIDGPEKIDHMRWSNRSMKLSGTPVDTDMKLLFE